MRKAGPNDLTEAEQRHRSRPLDLIVNQRSRNMIHTRDNMNFSISKFLRDRGYVGVETLILSSTAGGAAAKPFVTYHNDLKRNLFLRIATKLPLKQLVIGGIDRVFQIGRVFRNDDINLTHNPDFSSCEFYQADANYKDMMALTEEMMSGLVNSVTGSYVTEYTTQVGETYEINWAAPWKRIEMIQPLNRQPEFVSLTVTSFTRKTLESSFSVSLRSIMSLARNLKQMHECLIGSWANSSSQFASTQRSSSITPS